jgi:hypothetical protein
VHSMQGERKQFLREYNNLSTLQWNRKMERWLALYPLQGRWLYMLNYTNVISGKGGKIMSNAENNIRKSLLKRQEAMQKHVARQEDFLIRKEQMIKDIEQARTYWKNTMGQLPKSEFTF